MLPITHLTLSATLKLNFAHNLPEIHSSPKTELTCYTELIGQMDIPVMLNVLVIPN